MLLLSSPVVIEYFTEFRSYFPQMCLLFVVASASLVIGEIDEDLEWRRHGPFVAMVVPSFVVALNVHYFATLLVGVLASCLFVWCLVGRKRRWAFTVLATLVIGCIPLLAFLRVHASFLSKESSSYWVSGSVIDALLFIVRAALAAMESNPVALVVAIAAMLMWLALVFQAWRLPASETVFSADFARQLELTPQRRRAVLLLVVALTIFSVALLVAHARRPVVFPRYLLTFQVVVMALVAAVAAEALASRRVLLVLLVLVAAGIAVHQSAKRQAERRWEATAQTVSKLIAACPSSPVYAARLPGQWQSVNGAEVAAYGYRWLGRRYGFDVTYLPLKGAGEPLPISSGACPSLLWVEHVSWERLARSANAEMALRFLGADTSNIDLAGARFMAGETGFVLKLPAKGAAATSRR